MGFRMFIIRHEKENAWLTQILADGKEKVYRYMPDIGMAKKYETITEASMIANACRGRVQMFKMDKKGQPYAEDIKK